MNRKEKVKEDYTAEILTAVLIILLLLAYGIIITIRLMDAEYRIYDKAYFSGYQNASQNSTIYNETYQAGFNNASISIRSYFSNNCVQIACPQPYQDFYTLQYCMECREKKE